MQLTGRQARILRAVVLEHQATGRPVGSRTLVERGIIDASSSTVRYELGRLEAAGLLEHPHTSAGRVPTDSGYRLYIDQLMDIGDADDDATGDTSRAMTPATMRQPAVAEAADRLDEALQSTTRALADATELLAVVTAPRTTGAIIRHVEVLQLQPTTLVVVCITSSGDVTRHVVSTRTPIDPGLVDWAGEYLAETVTGMALGANQLRHRLSGNGLGPREQDILRMLAPAFSDLVDEQQEVHVGGSARLVAELGNDVQRVVNLVAMLDERRRLLSALHLLATRTEPARRVSVRVGSENEIPELQRLSVVGAAYGLAARPLGMVGLIGPRTMDYGRAMIAVHAAADGLSLFSEDLHAG